METIFEIILLILIIATIGMILGYFIGSLNCKKISNDHIIKKGKICEKKKNIDKEQNDLLEKEAKELIEASKKDSLFDKDSKEAKTQEEKEKKLQNELQNSISLKKEIEEKSDKDLTIDEIKKSIGALEKNENTQAEQLQKIKGIGNVIEKKLNSLGIYNLEQIASWGEKEIALVDKYLTFKGRIKREKWVEQAKALVKSKDI